MGRVEVQLQWFLNLLLFEDVWSGSFPGTCTLLQDPPNTHWIGSWVGPRVSLNVMEKKKSLVTDRNWTLDRPAHYLFTVITTSSSSTHMLSRHLFSFHSLFEVRVSLLWSVGHWLVIVSVSGTYVKGLICRFKKLHDHWEEIIHIVMWSASEMPFGSQAL